MRKMLRKMIRLCHPDGIPGLGALVYNAMSRKDIFQHHYQLVADDVARYCTRGRMLDVGTGPGWLLLVLKRRLPKIQPEGLDISAAMVNQAQHNMQQAGYGGKINLRIGSVYSLPYPDSTFGCVVSTGSMHHWKKMDEAFREIYRVLKRDGYALIYDLVQNIPRDVLNSFRKDFGGYRSYLLWLHSFEEPFYDVDEVASIPAATPFKRGEIHFTGALGCLVLRKEKV